MEKDLKILKVEYLSNHLLDHGKILNLSIDDDAIFLQILKMKTTSNGRRPQNIDSGVSKQPLIGLCSNLKVQLR
jgi:hypothetical protein